MIQTNQTQHDDQLLRSEQAAEFLGIAASTLPVWRCQSRAGSPPFIRMGRCVRYRVGDLRAWMAANTVSASESED